MDMAEPRGDARGGVVVGAGSLDRTLWTRASRRCIWAARVRMWVRVVEVVERCAAALRCEAVVRCVVVLRCDDVRTLAGRELTGEEGRPAVVSDRGLGVA